MIITYIYEINTVTLCDGGSDREEETLRFLKQNIASDQSLNDETYENYRRRIEVEENLQKELLVEKDPHKLKELQDKIKENEAELLLAKNEDLRIVRRLDRKETRLEELEALFEKRKNKRANIRNWLGL